MHSATDGTKLGQPLVETSGFSYYIGKYREPGSFYDSTLKVCSSQWRRIHANLVRPANTSNVTSAHVTQHNL